MDKSLLSERDVCTKFITPAVKQAGWDEMSQIREEVGFTKGRIIVRGKLVARGKAKRADYNRTPTRRCCSINSKSTCLLNRHRASPAPSRLLRPWSLRLGRRSPNHPGLVVKIYRGLN